MERARTRLWLVVGAVLLLGASGEAPAPGAVPEVRITGRLLDVEGHTEVPAGLLGLHADTKLSTERARDWGVEAFRQIHFVPGSGSIVWGKDGQLREPFRSMPVVIDCQGDRFYPALVLTRPDYEDYFTRIGRDYARKCKDLGWHGYAEFWNEPYLNWAERSRKNYDPKFYDVSKAVEGGPVTIKGWDRPLKYLRWRRLWARGEDGKINYLVPVPEGAKPGDTFEHELRLYFAPKGKRTYTVVEKWDVYDPTAVSFWSGKQNYDFYLWMFRPWARAIKETNPDITVIGGWDFALTAGNWASWRLLYKPLIDDAIEYLDGITEHHYGSNTRVNAASYEVAVGYALAEHGKRLHCYNTETAGCVDPAVPGNRHGNATPYGAYNYGLRDIVELVYRSPDKAVSRIAHGSLAPGWGGGGDEFLFKLLKDLRGRLVHTACEDLDVWPVASLNGDRLVVVVFNDQGEARDVRLAIEAPDGTELRDGRETWVEPVEPKGPLAFHEEAVAASGRRFEATVTLPQKTGAKWVFPLAGKPPSRPQVVRRQTFAKGILNEVQPRKPVTLKVAVDPDRIRAAESAWVKVVLEKVDGDEATVRVNGRAVRVPDHDWLTEVRIDPVLLKADTTLVFETSGDGYRVDVASVVLDGPPEAAPAQAARPKADADAGAAHPAVTGEDRVYHTVVDGVDFKLLVPSGIETLRGLIVHVANYRMKPKDRWAELCRQLDFGHIALSMDLRRTNRPKLMRAAIDRGLELAAAASGHAELPDLPMAGVGHSAGGLVTRTLLATPERALTNCVSCAWIMDPAKMGAAERQVPACFTLGEIPDAFKMLPDIEAKFIPARRQGLPWGLAVQHGCAHDWGNSAALFVPWIVALAEARLARGTGAGAVRAAMAEVDVRAGWLGDLDSTHGVWAEVAPYADYGGDRSRATWLPNETVAWVWRAMMAEKMPVQLTAGTPDGGKTLGPYRPKSGFELMLEPDESLVLGVTVGGDQQMRLVTFYDGARKLGDARGAPWQWRWESIPAGCHVVSAVWTLTDGTRGTTNPALLIRRFAPSNHPVSQVEMP